MKTKLNTKILAALLAVLLFLSCCPMFSFAELFPEDFHIAYEGKKAAQIDIYIHEKKTVTAENLPEGSTYQWQIRIPGTDTWVNIQGQTGQELGISYALVGSLMVNGSASVRCAAVGGETVCTDTLKVTVTEEPEEIPMEETEATEATAAPTEEAAEETSAPTEPETVPDVTEETTEAETIPETTAPTQEQETTAPTQEQETTAPTEEAVPETTVATESEAVPETTESVNEFTAPTEDAESAAATEATEENITAPTEEAAATEDTEAAEETSAPTAPETVPDVTEETAAPAEEAVPETTEASAPMMRFTLSRSSDVDAAAEEPDGDTNGSDMDAGTDSLEISETEFVTVTIHYRAVTRNDRFVTTGEDATVLANAVTATAVTDSRASRIFKGTDLEITIPCHVMPGYSLEVPAYHAGAGLEVVAGTNNLKVNLKNVTEDMDFYIYYKEKEVSYTARYFIQNVYNDLYTEDNTILTPEVQEKMKGYPGDEPKAEIIYPVKYGFTALFFQPDTIAADGSTVFEVYYDRNYYLINFNMDGGFGSAPVYARYETAFTISPPTRSGYSFDGWEEQTNLRNINTDGSAVEDTAYTAALAQCIADIPKTANGRVTKIPFSNLTYKAKWNQAQTTYKVAYWIDNKTGADTYIGSDIVEGQSGDPILGFKQLGTTVGTSAIICGMEEHTHDDTCKCNHTHSPDAGCYDGFGTYTTVCPYANAFNGLGQQNGSNEEPKSGYAYKLERVNDDSYTTQYMAVYRAVKANGQADTAHYYTISEDDLGAQIESITVDGYTLTKYQAKLACGHIHGSSCDSDGYVCGIKAHTHTPAKCYQDTRHMVLVRSDLGTGTEVTKDIRIEGDGSTVLNVYYQYKEYTLRFYYARTTGGTATDNDKDPSTYDTVEVAGGSTYAFGKDSGVSTSDDGTLLNEVGAWGTVTALPVLSNDKGYTRGTLDANGFKYHYIEFKAQYGDDISGKWPHDVFAPAARPTFTSQSNGWTGTHAILSAWNGEHHVAYCYNEYNGTGNQTIKGIYEELDEKLLFKNNFTDETTVSYLAFWENGHGDTNWNVPELYIYNIWLPYTKDDFSTLPENQKRTKNGVNYILHRSYNTCDNSDVTEQTAIAIEGYTENKSIRGWAAHFIGGMWKNASNHYYVWQNDGDKLKYDGQSVHTGGWSYPIETGKNDVTVIRNGGTDAAPKYLLYTTVGDYAYDPNNPGTVINHNIYREAYTVDFYYKANGPFTLNFWNLNDYMVDGEGEQFYYGDSLRKFKSSDNNTFMTEGYTWEGKTYGPYYPDTLEPGAYEFIGWYTSSECYDSTRVNWETMTMPNADLTVYAKWEPVTYQTYFYMDYERYEAKESFHTTSGTAHGQSIESSQLNAIRDLKFKDKNDVQIDKYRFVNWFYIDTDGTKKAFNPSEMAVRKELHLFAEWTTTIVQEYEVSYVYGVWDETQKKYVPATDVPFELAKNSTGYALEATTKTFSALPKDKLTQFPTINGENTSGKLWLPHTNSHSIVMRAPETKVVDGKPVTVNPNVYTFYYIIRDKAPYTVRYLDAATHEPIWKDENGNEIRGGDANNQLAVVTETFKYFENYIPDAFHKRLVLSANADENEIIFYYTKDDDPDDSGSGSGGTTNQRSPYLIVHHYPEIPDNPSSETVIYEEAEENGLDYVGATVAAAESGRLGFVFDEAKTKEEYTKRFGEGLANSNVKKNAANKWTVSGVVTTGEDNASHKPLELHLYYTRNNYGYTVKHCDWESNTVIKITEDGEEKELIENGTAVFGSTVTKTSKTISGYDVYAPDVDGGSIKTLTLEISPYEEQNVITFYYVKKKVTVEYVPICTDPGLTSGFGGVSNPLDYGLQTPRGSQAAAESGFHFMGWYTSQTPDASKMVTDKALLAPTDIKISPGIYDYTYYAIFKPITLTISQTGLAENETAIYEVVDKNGNVVLTVALTGKGKEKASVTIEQIPAGDYTVTELTDWTWKNGKTMNSQSVTVHADPTDTQNKVSFTYTRVATDWLHGETHCTNNFAKYVKPDTDEDENV